MYYTVGMKQPVHFRFSQEAVTLLQRMADANGISRTAMLEIAIREAAQKRGMRADLRIQTESEPEATRRDR